MLQSFTNTSLMNPQYFQKLAVDMENLSMQVEWQLLCKLFQFFDSGSNDDVVTQGIDTEQ